MAALLSLVSASPPPVFCKCTCFKNSTIIPLGPKSQQSASSPRSLLRRSFFSRPLAEPDAPGSSSSSAAIPISNNHDHSNSPGARSPSTSCSECTKSFCLSQGIDFCKDAKEDDVLTMCFQRDSNKDKMIVWGFILGTSGLLGWAAFKRVVEHRDKRALPRQDISYAPVGNER
ncbi:uncharacterized protein UV8b_00796 [Ustilaginoidea virens]|uniref:Uncharacterized protein n=1 Tax=Ustilaginoidea virens TaxID=1159556 RepID=A0A8E5HJF7_USTVR|nr:uncharacterized protein UV8b_00796 [Ustilaginoidea virens]QUC16555.1 hypothetical protein UV8b_00796 [Ustilaginoidea virens]